MIDIDRLIKAWKIFRDSNPYEICDGREFRAIKEPEYCMGQMIDDTITLLKEQEAVEPITEHYLFLCSVCKNTLFREQKYCHECGKRIEWKGR